MFDIILTRQIRNVCVVARIHYVYVLLGKILRDIVALRNIITVHSSTVCVCIKLIKCALSAL